jgi:hypothetical protein
MAFEIYSNNISHFFKKISDFGLKQNHPLVINQMNTEIIKNVYNYVVINDILTIN